MIPITFAKFNKHWLRMISVAVPELKDKAGIFWREANELNLIFPSIVNKTRQKI